HPREAVAKTVLPEDLPKALCRLVAMPLFERHLPQQGLALKLPFQSRFKSCNVAHKLLRALDATPSVGKFSPERDEAGGGSTIANEQRAAKPNTFIPVFRPLARIAPAAASQSRSAGRTGSIFLRTLRS